MNRPLDCEAALAHPLRQALFTLLHNQPASGPELQAGLRQPLQIVNYHLCVMVEHGCLHMESQEGVGVYRLSAQAAHIASKQMGAGAAQERIVMLSLLDAAWTALGRSPDNAPLRPRWETILLDEDGLIEASALVEQALERIRAVGRLSQQRRSAGAAQGPMHLLVAVASLIESSEDRP